MFAEENTSKQETDIGNT